MSAQQQEAETIFLAALDKTTPEERAAFVDGACAGKPELRARVHELLESHEESRGPLDVPIVPVAAELPDAHERGLDDKRVSAGAPGGGDRLGTLLLRYPGKTAAAAGILGLLLTATIVSSLLAFWAWQTAKDAQDELNAVKQAHEQIPAKPSVVADDLDLLFDDLRQALNRDELPRAAELLEQARQEEQIALKADPPVWIRRPNLTAAYQDYGERLMKLGKYGELAEVANERSRIFPDGWRECHWAADYLLRSTRLAFADKMLSNAERMAIGKKCQGTRDLLREAIQRGAKVFPDAQEAELLGITGGANASSHVQWMKPWGAERWSNGYQLHCQTAKGGYVVLGLPVAAAGDYRLGVHFSHAANFGIAQVSLDDQKIGKPFDGYDTQVRPSGQIDFGVVTLSQGLHHLRFTAIDKNEKSTAYTIGIDCVTLKKVGPNKTS